MLGQRRGRAQIKREFSKIIVDTVSRRWTGWRDARNAACAPGRGSKRYRAARQLPRRTFKTGHEQQAPHDLPGPGPGPIPGPSRACLPSPVGSRRTAMPGQRTRHGRRTCESPKDFPTRLERFREASGMTRSELDPRPGTHPHTMRRRNGGARPGTRHTTALPAPAGSPGLDHLLKTGGRRPAVPGPRPARRFRRAIIGGTLP